MPRSCLRQHKGFSSHLLQFANEVTFHITERALLDLFRLGSESILTQSASAFLLQVAFSGLPEWGDVGVGLENVPCEYSAAVSGTFC